MRLPFFIVLIAIGIVRADSTTQPVTQPTFHGGTTTGGAIAASLPSGVTVTLLGVSDNRDSDKRWWGVDGSTLKSPPYVSIPNHLGNKDAFELPFIVSGNDANGKPWSALNMHWHAKQTSLGLAGWRENGKNIPGAFVLLGVRQAGINTIDVALNFATNNEKTLLTLNIGEAHSMKGNDPIFGDMSLADPKDDRSSNPPRATITATVGQIPSSWRVYISALKDVRIVPPAGSPYIDSTHATEVAFTSPLQSDDAPEGVESFRLVASNQGTRMVFHNIAISPDVHSKPDVVIGDERE